MSDFLEHVIRETGHTCLSRRDEQQDEMLYYLKWLLVQAVQSGQTVAMPPLIWHVAAAATPDRMEAVLWHGMADGPPHLILHVATGDPPRCETTRMGLRLSANVAAAVLDADELERGFAWAWLESRPCCRTALKE